MFGSSLDKLETAEAPTRSLEELRGEFDVAEAAVRKVGSDLALNPPAPAHANPEDVGAHVAALVDGLCKLSRLYMATVQYQGAFTRYTTALDLQRQADLRRSEAIAEERAKEAQNRAKEAADLENRAEQRAIDAAQREAKADARARRDAVVSKRQTHWIMVATITMAVVGTATPIVAHCWPPPGAPAAPLNRSLLPATAIALSATPAPATPTGPSEDASIGEPSGETRAFPAP